MTRVTTSIAAQSLKCIVIEYEWGIDSQQCPTIKLIQSRWSTNLLPNHFVFELSRRTDASWCKDEHEIYCKLLIVYSEYCSQLQHHSCVLYSIWCIMSLMFPFVDPAQTIDEWPKRHNIADARALVDVQFSNGWMHGQTAIRPLVQYKYFSAVQSWHCQHVQTPAQDNE